MSRVLERRLERIEAATGPKVLGYYHCIYASDRADYERQKVALIASGRAKSTDLILDANWQTWQQRGRREDAPEYGTDVREPETHAWTMTWNEYLQQREREEAHAQS